MKNLGKLHQRNATKYTLCIKYLDALIFIILQKWSVKGKCSISNAKTNFKLEQFLLTHSFFYVLGFIWKAYECLTNIYLVARNMIYVKDNFCVFIVKCCWKKKKRNSYCMRVLVPVLRFISLTVSALF